MAELVAYQGVAGAYSEQAASFLAPGKSPAPFPTFEDVFDAVRSGVAVAGVIPIENSVHGAVHANYDLLNEHRVVIQKELQLRISHCLMCLPETTATEITEIRSHPQALGQCKRYLSEHFPTAARKPVYDTAGAAKDISDRKLATAAAIASRRAAEIYGLTIIGEDLQSHAKNYTRFFLVTNRPESPGSFDKIDGPVKTSLVLSMLSNVPGALFKCLAVFALREIDLLKIESRPNPGSPGEYQFYLDVNRHVEDDAMAKAMDHLDEITSFVRVLGCYPQGEYQE